MRRALERFSFVDQKHIVGVRAPRSEPAGDVQFREMQVLNFGYDASAQVSGDEGPFWPQTLDFRPPWRCVRGQCPVERFPSIWQFPVSRFQREGQSANDSYNLYDALKPGDTSSDVLALLKDNFHHSLSSKKAPFVISLDANTLRAIPGLGVVTALESFLEYVLDREDVYVVTMSQALKWLRRPTKLAKVANFASWECNIKSRQGVLPCENPSTCTFYALGEDTSLYQESDNSPRMASEAYSFRVCGSCPLVYPTLRDPTGNGNQRRGPAIHKTSAPSSIQPQCPKNKEQRKELGMLTTQARLCRKMPAIMPVVTNAARYAVHTCQSIFEDRRWNCSSVNFAPKLKPDLTKGTKEQAFVYALSAAAVTHQIAKACATGELGSHCTCGYGDSTAVTAEMGSVAPNVDDTYKWKGCSDNLLFGKQLSREWTDSAWRRVHSATFNTNDYAINGGVQRRGLLFGRKRNIQSGGNGFMDGDISTYFVEGITSRTLGPKARMNQHNSDIGRQITEQSLYRKCKCHGVSSSCDVRTCWYTLPPLEQIADRIKERYNSAQMINQLYPDDVKIDTRSLRMTADSKHELVFIKSSPDYCEENSELGSPGTNMRECNVTSTGPDSCESLCCGRGFNTQQIRVEEQCHCKYVHCCYIKCKRCAYVLDKHYCK